MDAETKPILVVDDNPITARWVESLVRRIGFEVIVAFDGEDAIHQLAEQPVGIVISDVEMPVMNGFDLLQFIRLRWPELPVILMSATSNAERREAARRLGPPGMSLEAQLARAERSIVESALKRFNGNREHAARELSVSRSTLFKRLKEWGLSDE